MAVYSLGFTSVAPLTGAPYATFHTGSSYRMQILELAVFCNAATASSVGLIRPSNSPVASTSVLGLAENPADPASTVNVDTAWSTVPTIGTSYLRKITLPATIGAGMLYQFPADKPLIVPVSSFLVLWNFGAATASVLNGYVKWME